MLQYVLAGLALGSIYAIMSAGIVITYVSAGVLNFAFGSMAYVIARSYYWAYAQQGWSIPAAAAFCLLVLAPVLGIVLWAVLFRFLRLRSPLVKVVCTIGLSVSLPALADLIFGQTAIPQAPGLAPEPVRTFHLLGSVVDLNQVITYGCVVLVGVLGTLVLRYTRAGLHMRALVGSEALTSLSGVNPNLVSVGVWAVSTMLAGLAGILVAPTNGLTSNSMTLLMAASFAAVVAARLRSLPIAVGVAMLMGVVTDVAQKYINPQSTLSVAILPSIPFAFILIFLLMEVFRSRQTDEQSATGGALDRSLQIPRSSGVSSSVSVTERLWSVSAGMSLVVLVVIAILPVLFSGYWLGLIATAFALSIALLSYTLVTGEGGMIWLCQITFAGAGAIGAAQLTTVYHWPVLLAIFVSALAIVPVGVILGLLTIRLGGVYVALVTLSLGLLVETLVFVQNRFYNFGQGVPLSPPQFASSTRVFAYLALGVFLVLALLIVNLRRSTMGLAMGAARSAPVAAGTLGLNVTRAKLVIAAFATFVAAVGGGFIAMNAGAAIPTSFDTLSGLVWLAVLITIGVRSIPGVIVAGLGFVVVPSLFQNYLPSSWVEVPTVLFGLGAIMVALNPEDAASVYARHIQRLVFALFRDRARVTPADVNDRGVAYVEPEGVEPRRQEEEVTAVLVGGLTTHDTRSEKDGAR